MSEKRSGFILPAVVTILAVLALVLLSATFVVSGLVSDLSTTRAMVKLETNGATAEARLQFMLAQNPLGPRGLRLYGQRLSRNQEFGVPFSGPPEAEALIPEVDFHFDGRPMRISTSAGALLVGVQDEAGLININALRTEMSDRLADLSGSPEETQRALSDSLMDYLDVDDLRRLKGAEDEDYRRAGLPPPANAPARMGEELFRVKGWSRPDHSKSELLRSSITAAPPSLAFNVNTANQAVMRVWFGLTPDEAQRVADYRATQTLTGAEHITRLTGRTIIPDELRLYTFPGNRFRIRLLSSEASSHQVYQSWVTIAPALSDQPFFVSPSIVRLVDVVEWGSDVNHEDVDLPPLESGTGKGG